MKNCIRLFSGAALIVMLAFTGCKTEVNLTQDQMVSKLDENSKNAVFDEVLAGKNAEELLVKLSDEQKAAIYDKMVTDEKKSEIFASLLTDEKKAEIYKEMLTDTEKASIFNSLLTDEKKAEIFAGLLTDEKKTEIYKEKLTDTEKAAIFDSLLTDEKKVAIFDSLLTAEKKTEIFNSLLTDEKKDEIYNEKLTDTEKAAIFDELLKTKTNKDFIVGIITKEGNEALYADVKAYIIGKLTKAELVALLEAADNAAPGEVTNLTASVSPKGNEVVLTWTDGTDTDNDLYGYLVSWKEAPVSRSIAALSKDSMMVAKSSNADKSNEATVTGLTAGTKYSFTVQAIDLTGNKSTGVSVEATPVETSVTVSETGTYTVYHFHQSDSGSVAIRDYYRDSTEEDKTVEKGSTLETLKKDYPGFTAKVLTQFGSSIYVFYDRNTITYTFNAGSEGKFEDDTTSKEVSGLYGTRFSEPRTPKREGYRFIKWQNESDTELPNTFGAEDISWTAVWAEGTEITLTCNVCGETHIIDVEGCDTWTDIINKNPYVINKSGFVIYEDETHSGDIHRNGYGFYYTSTFMDGGTFTIDRPWY